MDNYNTPNMNKNISENLLPRFYRSNTNKKFLQATIDQLIQPGSVEKISGFIGRQNSKAAKATDIFIKEKDVVRQNYQLEPSLVIKDELNNITFFKDYQDYINQIKILGGNIENHSRLNQQEFYSWNPHIDWDKFVNFQNYFWYPNGPLFIDNFSIISSTFNVTIKNQIDKNVYLFSEDGNEFNPTITLFRGQTYYFDIDSPGNPFSIKTSNQIGSLDRYIDGVDNFAVEYGVIKFLVTDTTPDILYYQSEIDDKLGGKFEIKDILELDVKLALLGKKHVIIKKDNNEFNLSNGIKIKLDAVNYYIEGVGSSIKLIDESRLAVSNVDFINSNDGSNNQNCISYVVINRSNQVHNLWSRFNRWFHKDVLLKSAAVNNETIELLDRAARPILEFDGSLALFNYGTKFVNDIDLLDSHTNKIKFINEKSDYYIDGVSLVSLITNKPADSQYVTVLFTACESSRENNQIYKISIKNQLLSIEKDPNFSTVPTNDQVVLIRHGKNYFYNSFWYTQDPITNIWQWKKTQQKPIVLSDADKEKQNYAPVFDVVDVIDDQIVSYGNNDIFTGSDFSGTKLFSYKINNNGVLDPILNLKLSYKNIENSGDIVFNFDFEIDQFSYKDVVNKKINTGFLKKISENSITLVNGWITSKVKDSQPAIRIYKNTNVITSEEDKLAPDYINGKIYYPGDIVRFYDNNLYQVKLDGTVSNSGTTESPPEVVDIFIKSFIGNNTTSVIATIDNTFRYFKNDIITISNSDISMLNGEWVIDDILSSNSFSFTISFPLNSGEYPNKTAKVVKSKNTQSWNFYSNSLLTLNKFNLDIFDDKLKLDDLILKIYVNNNLITNWFLMDGIKYKTIVLDKSIGYNDVLTIKAISSQPINNNGYYEFPINLQNNPLNSSIKELTFGEIVDHTNSITNNLNIISLRDVGDVAMYGTKFVQHSSPISIALYHLTSETNNIIKAIEQARNEYTKFKRNFINVAENLGIDTDTVSHVNLILQEINRDKSSNFPYYFSDMVAYTTHKKTDFVVTDYRTKKYPLSYNESGYFNLTTLSNKSVYVYHNNNQLVYDKEYQFDSIQGFVVININLQKNDIISLYEYDSSDGCFIPETPTKLGIWPKYEPKKYIDTTLITPREMIQGHDGSLILAYGDYRDDLILELEKRIYNNIKIKYDPNIFDINDVIPSYTSYTDYSLSEFNEILSSNFYQWLNLVNKDFSKPLGFNVNDPRTFNYSDYYSLDNRSVPGYWRGIYQWMLGTDRPHLCPWEMIGFSEEPLWWKLVYGLPPYTNQNLKMWKDLSLGIVREPNKPIIQNPKYIRSFLLNHIPVDISGNLLDPLASGLVIGSGMLTEDTSFVFGDISPVEAAWRRNSHYPFSVIITALLMFPAKTFGLSLDRSRVVKNPINQLIYKDTKLRITPKDIKIPNIINDLNRIQTSGIINYLVNYITSNNLDSLMSYTNDLQNLNCQLGYRIGGFTSKNKFNLLLDSKSPLATGNIFVPKEDYNIFLNVSSPVKKVSYSGVIITKLYDGFEVKGYIKSNPYFKCYSGTGNGIIVNVGGISESYLTWIPNQFYSADKIVSYGNNFYRIKFDHNSGSTFDLQYYQLLKNLPIIGGRNAIFKITWDKSQTVTVPYGTKFVDIQQVVDFLLGYGEWLKDQGFEFNQFNTNINQVLNWETSAKEFLFWTLQNWSSGEDQWEEWQPNIKVPYNSIVKYNGEYYRALRNVPIIEDDIIYPDREHVIIVNNQPIYEKYYEKLDGLSTVGSSVISLSPSAYNIVLNTPLSMVSDVRNQFYGYEILSVNGTPIFTEYLDFYRNGNVFTCSAINDIGIYAATFYLVQKEQVLVLNNTTIFNDLIYDPFTGYKQDRIRVSGYVSTDWNGGFIVPGFIFDQAKIQEWSQWRDYALGDMVKYKEFYYSANSFIAGSETFDVKKWLRLNSAPTSELIPNWSYKALQFTDFHNLDSDNFDSAQQRAAQHLIGYQKRQYLNNIIQDDVSEFKFYQGMISEKGTQNVFNKLFDVLSRSEKESLEFYEEWALRIGRYGGTAAYDTIEIVLDESQFKNNPQGFELVNVIDNTLVDFIIRQRLSDVYVTPTNTTNWPNILPMLTSPKTFLRSAGMVDEGDIRITLKSIDDIVDQDINLFNHGDYIWCTFDKNEWNVYKFIKTNVRVTNIEYINSNWKITFQLPVQIKAGAYVGFNKFTNKGNGFYLVTDSNEFSITISADSNAFTVVTDELSNIEYSEITGQHVRNFDDLANNNIGYQVFTKKLVNNNLLWVGGVSNVPSSTWIYKSVFSQTSLRTSLSIKNNQFGRNVAVSKSGLDLITSINSGKIYSYIRTSITNYWSQQGIISKPVIYTNEEDEFPTNEYAKVLAISDDGNWIASAAPLAKNVLISQNGAIYSADQTNTSSIISKSQGVVFLYQKINNIFELQYSVVSNLAIDPKYEDNYEEFGSSLIFVGDRLFISAAKFKNREIKSRNIGRVYCLDYNNRVFVGTIDGNPNWYNDYYSFGYFIAANPTNTIIAIPSQTGIKGQITLYNVSDFMEIFSIPSEYAEKSFGRCISFSLIDNYIAISSNNKNNGVIYIYSYDIVTKKYVKLQTISDVFSNNNEKFGSKFAFIRNYNTTTDNNNSLAICTYPKHLGYDSSNYDTFLYDNELTFYSSIGQRLVNIYDNYFDKWILSESVLNINSDTYNQDYDNSFTIGQDCIFIGCPTEVVSDINTGMIYEYRNKTAKKNFSWTIRNVESDRVDSSKIKRVYLYNKRTNTLLNYLDNVDCILGKIPGVADQEIRYKTYYDPATYSDISNLTNRSDLSDVTFSKTINDNVVNIDNGLSWAEKHVGLLWWDLRTAKFVDIYGKANNKIRDITYRNSMQNTLAVGASIDIYEWVGTKYKPSEWDNLTDTEEGLAQGISGTSLYGDEVYCITRKYDNIGKSYKNTYYFWVKNKTTVPNIFDRKLSANSIANLIANPRSQGYQYLAITGSDKESKSFSFSLVNVERSLIADDIVLAVEYWTTSQTNQNIHNQWQLVSNEVNSQIPINIEEKWFDSLCGKDKLGYTVPDLFLSKKLMYGVENRPRQSMFINRFEALKQLVDYANSVLINYQVSEQRSLAKLQAFDEVPTIYSRLYDLIVDSDNELADIDINNIKTAVIKPIIDNGRIIDISILNPGFGYVGNNPVINENGEFIGWYGPSITVLGIGKGASIISIIDSNGSLITKDYNGNKLNLIIDSGEGYLEKTTSCVVRDFSVLVNQDGTTNNWAIYSYSNEVWVRIKAQSYNTKNYWDYIDWYKSGYNQYSIISHAVDTFVDLMSIDADIGDLVKVRSDGSGKWVLLEKYSNFNVIDWSGQYKVVGSEKGTIKLLPSLYDPNLIVGYDGNLYDSTPYDSIAIVEIRNILEALRDDILIDDLRIEYLNLFFSSLRYAHSEQHYLDWAFKTSFIKAKHNVGIFNNRVTYQNDNLENYEDYVTEMKPYRTKIREYISCYNQLELVDLSVTDFDLPPVYENQKTTVINVKLENEQIFSDNTKILSYPWRYWYDNCIPKIIGFDIINPGAGYGDDAEIKIHGESHSLAIAKPVIVNGQLVDIKLIDPGKGYFFRPEVRLEGPETTPAEIIPIIGSVIRSPFIKLKFDRISKFNFIDNIVQIEEFDSNQIDGFVPNETKEFKLYLQWPPSNKTNETTISIIIGDIEEEILSLSYKLSTFKTYDNYGSVLYQGVAEIKLDKPLLDNSIIRIKYYLDQNILTAADRIKNYYSLTDHIPEYNFFQVSNGIDYGGVTISGLDLTVSHGWDTLPFYTDKWGFSDDNFKDYTASIPLLSESNTYLIQLPYVPLADKLLTVYYSKYYRNLLYVSENILDYQFDNDINLLNVEINFFKQTTVLAVIDSEIIYLNNTNNIKIGDTIIYDNYLAYNTTVIDKTISFVRLSCPVIKNIESNSEIRFSRKLFMSKDFKIYSKGILSLLESLSNEITLIISGYKPPIRIDNINFEKTWNIIETTITDILTTDTDITFEVGDSIKFTGSVYGNIVENVIYYVHSIIDTRHFKISAIQNGSPFTLSANIGSMILNPMIDSHVIMNSIISDGISQEIEIPELLESKFGVISLNDKFIVRETTSDGSIQPFTSDFDTAIDGGDLTYSTAKGLLIDDLVIDGDDLISSRLSSTPEEVVDSQLGDTVAIKVFDQPRVNTSTISANIAVDTYISDGVTKEFNISQTPNSPDAVIVKTIEPTKIIKLVTVESPLVVNNIISSLTAQGRIIDIDDNILQYILLSANDFVKDEVLFVDSNRIGIIENVDQYPIYKIDRIDYQLDYTSNQIKFTEPLPINSEISIFSIGFNGGAFSVEYIKSDGNRLVYTKYPYSIIYYRIPVIYINGVVQSSDDFEFIKTEIDALGIQFNKLVFSGSLISVLFVDNDDTTFAITRKERFLGNGSIYELEYPTGESIPIEDSMIVIVDKEILSPSELLENKKYTYTSNPPKITFSTNYDYNNRIEIISSYKHDIFNIVRLYTSSKLNTYEENTPNYYRYSNIASGLIKLDQFVINDDYIWVTKNGMLLTPKIDYRLTENHQNIQLADISDPNDKFDIIIYGNNLASDTGIAYMQFKDILNRTHFKRLNINKRTRLIKELKYNDTVIELEDASNFEIPNKRQNKPGIIEIYGERIEYFSIIGNKLSSLRRGTLGTGVLSVYPVGTFVQDISSSETIPYSDTTNIRKFIYQGDNTIELKVIDNDIGLKYQNELVDDELKSRLSKNAVDIFVGGYETPEPWTPVTKYYLNDLVILGEYVYKCIVNHTSSNTFRQDYNFKDSLDETNKWQYFTGNIHLKKDDYMMHNYNKNRLSPEGDIKIAADFTVENNVITLTNDLTLGTQITLTRKIGLDWDSVINIQDPLDVNTNEKIKEIAEFINAVPGALLSIVK